MKLSREEDSFLRRWIYDEAHYQEGMGSAKRLQLQHRITPADLADLIAAGIPDLTDQETAAFGPPPAGPAVWPWPEETLRARLIEARAILAQRHRTQSAKTV